MIQQLTPGTSPSPVSPIDLAGIHILEQLRESSDLTAQLRERLERVIKPEPPAGVGLGPQQSVELDVPSSELCTAILDWASRIGSNNNRLKDLIRRLEL